MNTRRAKVKCMKTCSYSEHVTIDWNKFNAHKTFHYIHVYNKTVMGILLSKYGLIFTEFESIDLGSASVIV